MNEHGLARTVDYPGPAQEPDARETAQRIERYVREQFQVNPDDPRFGRDADLFGAGYVDSIGFVELLAFLEEEFGVEVPEEQLLSDEFTSIDGIARVVSRLAG